MAITFKCNYFPMKCMAPFLVLLTITVNVTYGQNTAGEGTNNATVERFMAVTIDDLPVNSRIPGIPHREYVTVGILEALKKHKVPGIGFVNEGKLFRDGRPVDEKVGLLQKWLDYGMELGNHGFSHADYNKVSFQAYKSDIVQGEKITNKILSTQNQRVKYFRHPYLHAGDSQEKKDSLATLLKAMDYEVAPVTIDNSEWIFARAYENAFMKKDSALMKKIGKAYVDYMEDKTAYFERQSKALWGYEILQVLLIHANQLNADYLDALLTRMEGRKYGFISLEKALTDKVYKNEDTFVGKAGISWIDRWALGMGKKGSFFKDEPTTPLFVQEVAEISE